MCGPVIDLWNPLLDLVRGRARIDCDRLLTDCPGSWSALQELTHAPRFQRALPCPTCARDVYLTTDEDDLIDRVSRGYCVAVLHKAEVPELSQMEEQGLYAGDLPDEDDIYLDYEQELT